jgi:hypothetical protein
MQSATAARVCVKTARCNDESLWCFNSLAINNHSDAQLLHAGLVVRCLPLLSGACRTALVGVCAALRGQRYSIIPRKRRSRSPWLLRIVYHPVWGEKYYPASLFSTAPAELLIATLESL